MTMTVYKNGPRAMVQYTPASNYLAGDVIVLNGIPMIADTDNPVGTGLAIVQGALAVYGGVYAIFADAAYAVGTFVYWNAGAVQVTSNPAGNTPFGYIVAGPTGLASDGGPTGAAIQCWVLHAPFPQTVINGSAKLSTTNLSGATLAAGAITGGNPVFLTSTNAAPGTLTTRTATQMIADANLQVGQTYELQITQTGAGTLTLGAGAGVTLTGTMTVPTNTTRTFVVQVTSATAITITAVGTGTYS
jgi:hypothetical protein